jgi:hypothetical protein
MNVGSGNLFYSNKRSGLVDIGHRSLEGNTAGGREQEASRDVVPHHPWDCFQLHHYKFTGNSSGILLSNECSFLTVAFILW